MTRVLIVDDQPDFRRHLCDLLNAAGMQVVAEAADIPSAARLAQQHQPHLAVVDMTLPGCSGLNGVTRLKEAAPGMRIYLVSAYQDQSHLLHSAARAAGAEAFLPKDDLDLETIQHWRQEDEDSA